MRSILIALTIIAASALLPAAAASAECLPSGEAVFAAHGKGVHAVYQTINGHKCWTVERSQARIREVRPPLPQPRPAAIAAQDEIQILTTPAPIQISDLAPNPPLREAMESYILDNYGLMMWRARN